MFTPYLLSFYNKQKAHCLVNSCDLNSVKLTKNQSNNQITEHTFY